MDCRVKPGNDRQVFFVMAGLVPAIHVFTLGKTEDVDARHKAGHDGCVCGGIA
jgi:hypothetical protein